MTGVDFFVHAAVTGSVMGLQLGSSVGQIRDTLGTRCVEDRSKKYLRMDYGLIEFGLFNGYCENIAIQVHRLASSAQVPMPDVLRNSLDDVGRRIPLSAVRAGVEKVGDHGLEELPRQAGYQCHRVIGTNHVLIVFDEGSNEDWAPLQSGDLWSIMISGRS